MNRGIFGLIDTALQAAVTRAQATADNARQMVLNRDKVLADLDANTATLGDAIAAAGTEHANMRTEWETADDELSERINSIQLTPGPAGKDGADGQPGANGVDGKPGLNGTDGRNGIDGQPGRDGTNGNNGADGLSAYQVARAGGYGGTQTQWLASLVGPTGPAGPKGDKGDTGPAGVPTLQIEFRDGIAVPPVTSLLGLSATTDVTITWPNPMPDTNYVVTPQVSTAVAALIGKTSVTLKTKTTTGCVVTVTTTALIAAGQATLSAVAYRKS